MSIEVNITAQVFERTCGGFSGGCQTVPPEALATVVGLGAVLLRRRRSQR